MNFADLRGTAISGKLAQNAEPQGKGQTFPTGEGYIMEPKYDGWRIIAFVGEGHVDLFARSGNSYNGKLPKVEAELLDKFPAGTVVDGEAVALVMEGDKVINEWGAAQSAMTKGLASAAADKITFMLFDLIAHAGIDARALPYAKRRMLLERIFEAEPGFEAVALTSTTEASVENYEAFVAMGFEGAMIKRIDKPYGSDKREGAGWHKAKASTRVEVVVMGFKPGKNGFAGLVGAFIFGQHDPDSGELVERGSASGFDMRTRQDMTKNPGKWLGRVIEIAHMGVDIGKHGTGRFRHPQYKRVRKDKTADQVVMHDA